MQCKVELLSAVQGRSIPDVTAVEVWEDHQRTLFLLGLYLFLSQLNLAHSDGHPLGRCRQTDGQATVRFYIALLLGMPPRSLHCAAIHGPAPMQKGESFRSSPLCCPYFRRSGSGNPDHNVVIPGSCGMSVLGPSLPHSPVVTVVVRATSLPIARLVADSLDCHSVTLSFWKISLPLISKSQRRRRRLSANSSRLWKKKFKCSLLL